MLTKRGYKLKDKIGPTKVLFDNEKKIGVVVEGLLEKRRKQLRKQSVFLREGEDQRNV